MKIERLSENQIRCTLSKEDLEDRQIKLSELAYGSDKAKKLFQDMMIQASNEVGFEANDIPLVIEAIPVSSDCIVLIVTRVDDPEELDTRFAKFSPSALALDKDTHPSDQPPQNALHSAADILDLFKKITEGIKGNETASAKPADTASNAPVETSSEVPMEETKPSTPVDLTKIFLFHRLEDICNYAEIIHTRFSGASALYKDPKDGFYYLVLSIGKTTPELFNKICNIASEYGEYLPTSSASVAYFNEHFKIIIKNKVIQKLANL